MVLSVLGSLELDLWCPLGRTWARGILGSSSPAAPCLQSDCALGQGGTSAAVCRNSLWDAPIVLTWSLSSVFLRHIPILKAQR